MTDVEYRSARQPVAARASMGRRSSIPPASGIEKKGDQFQLYISWQGEPMHAEGAPVTFKTNGPFYVGIGFTSHLAATALTAKVAMWCWRIAPARCADVVIPAFAGMTFDALTASAASAAADADIRWRPAIAPPVSTSAPPFRSLTMPPASRTSTMPAATSQA